MSWHCLLYTSATVTVLILLRIDKTDKKEGESRDNALTRAEADENDRIYEPKNDLILQKVAGFLVPLIIIFGIYVILNGHLSPGGGFSGGAIIGAGLILYLNAFGFAKTERFFTEKTYKWICFCSLTCYCLLYTSALDISGRHDTGKNRIFPIAFLRSSPPGIPFQINGRRPPAQPAIGMTVINNPRCV